MFSQLCIGGVFFVECVDRDGRKLWAAVAPNGITTEGLASVMGVQFRGTAQLANWYAGLIGTGASLSATDTMASHNGWDEAHAEYSEASRPAWSPPAPVSSGGSSSLLNTASIEFTFTSAKIIDGIFITSDATKGGTDGTLWSTGTFASPRSMASGQQLRVFYQLTCSTT